VKGLYLLSYNRDQAQAGPLVWPRRAVRTLLMSPLLRGKLEERYEQHFSTAQKANLFRGVYASFEEAQRTAPPTKPTGYDNPGPAAMYRDRPKALPLSEYPVLFWLSRTVPGAKRLFDLGGHVGVKYYDFRTRLELPAGFTWQVMDVPAVVDAGRQLARETGATVLDFTSRREDVDGADVLYASGSLQYLEKPLHEIVAPLAAKPRHIIINLTPMHAGPAFYTLQSIGTAFCPYRIEDRPALVAGLGKLGYQLVDEWTCPEKDCPIPFHPDKSVSGYTGMVLRRA
jgi:putative methyltransferase (TIGR04325 family)